MTMGLHGSGAKTFPERPGFPGGIMQGILQKTLFPLLLIAASTAVSAQSKPSSARTDPSEVERGRYIVEEVAKCTECHTPRDSRGEPDRGAWLQGAPIWIMPVHPVSNWANRAPAIAGFPGFSEAEGERILEQGTGPAGETLRPPMHIYHMTHADAKAVIAYLKTVPGQVH